MPTILMPRLSDSMEEGVIVRWLVADGDEINVGQEIAEIETDKATMEFQAEDSGTIHLHAIEGATVAVGVVIASIGAMDDGVDNATVDQADEASTPEPASTPAGSSAGEAAGIRAGAGTSERRSETRPRADASPVARRLAASLGIDLGALPGTGPNGRVVKADVLRASDQAPASSDGSDADGSRAGTRVVTPTDAERRPDATERQSDASAGRLIEISRVQQLIARRMSQSKATAPDFVLVVDVDMEAAVALRTQLKDLIGADQKPPSFNDFVVKAAASALRAEPLANGSYRDGRFELHDRVNIGIAVAAPDALLVPTIFDADQKSLGQIARTSRELAQKVRDQTITPPELSGGTFSISNLGMFGVDRFEAVINPPQAAILAVGALARRAVVHADELQARHTMSLTLTCDHRILYGAVAAEFLADIKRQLETPGALVL